MDGGRSTPLGDEAGQALVGQRAVPAPGVVDRRGQIGMAAAFADGGGIFKDRGLGRDGDGDFVAAPRPVQPDRTVADIALEHFRQADRLGGELYFGRGHRPTAALVLDGKGRAVALELDDVSAPNKAVFFGPDVEPTDNRPPPFRTNCREVGALMNDVADGRGHVVGPRPVHRDERPLSGTVSHVLDLAHGHLFKFMARERWRGRQVRQGSPNR